jgi:hypothetical protein
MTQENASLYKNKKMKFIFKKIGKIQNNDFFILLEK